MDEAERQRDLLRALDALAASSGAGANMGLREQGERAARGLEAYRANAEAIAERALAAAFGTVRAMVGEEDFARLARELWASHPPSRGDLGEWGESFPEWLGAHAGMVAWPYLADCARLDLALHRNERAADAVLDAASLSLLESTDPSALHLVLMPGAALVSSGWPVVSIHRAHQLDGDAAERAFEAVRKAIAEPRAESAFVVREGWRAVVHALTPADARWTAALLAGADLATAFERAGEDFDFALWLQTAIRHTWLKGVVASND